MGTCTNPTTSCRALWTRLTHSTPQGPRFGIVIVFFSSNPLRTRIPVFIENASIFRQAQASRMTRTAALPSRRITQDGLVIDKKVGHPIVGIKLVLTRSPIVANVLVGAASGKASRVARPVGAVVLQAFVPFGKVTIKLGRDCRGVQQQQQQQ